MAEPARDEDEGLPPPRRALDPSLSGRNLRQAVATAAVLVVVAIAAYLLGPDLFFWLAVGVVLPAVYELFAAARIGDRRPAIGLALVAVLALMAAAYYRPSRPEYILAVLATAVAGSFALALRPNRGASPGSDAAWTVLGVAWIGGGGAAAVSMLTLPDGLNLLVAHVAVTAADDIVAYFVGSRLGRHRLAPTISPAKSWEGFAGGCVAALASGAVAGLLLDRLGIGHGLALGAIIALCAPVGDLAESLVKRELKVKDSSQLLPGHGGFLDRLDAIVFCAVPVLAYLRIVVF